jgi:hypothetical protein
MWLRYCSCSTCRNRSSGQQRHVAFGRREVYHFTLSRLRTRLRTLQRQQSCAALGSWKHIHYLCNAEPGARKGVVVCKITSSLMAAPTFSSSFGCGSLNRRAGLKKIWPGNDEPSNNATSNNPILAHEFTYNFAISMISISFALSISDTPSLPKTYMLLELNKYLYGRYGQFHTRVW